MYFFINNEITLFVDLSFLSGNLARGYKKFTQLNLTLTLRFGEQVLKGIES